MDMAAIVGLVDAAAEPEEGDSEGIVLADVIDTVEAAYLNVIDKALQLTKVFHPLSEMGKDRLAVALRYSDQYEEKYRSPVSINFNSHYVTIIGIQGTKIKYLESLSPHSDGIMYGDLSLMYRDNAELSWYQEFTPEQIGEMSTRTQQKDGKLEEKGTQRNENSKQMRTVTLDVTAQKHIDAMKNVDSKQFPGQKLAGEGAEPTVTEQLHVPKEMVA